MSFTIAKSADLDGDGVDEIIWLQTWGPNFGAQVDERSYPLRVGRVVDDQLHCEVYEDIVSVAPPRDFEFADLDGDGLPDLVVALDPASVGPGGMVSPDVHAEIAIYWGDAARRDRLSAKSTRYPAPPTALPARLLLAAIEADGDPGRELAYVTRDRVGVLSFGADRRSSDKPIDTASGRIEDLRAVDVDGNGLEDIVIATGTEIFVHLQEGCSARDAAAGTCTRTEAE